MITFLAAHLRRTALMPPIQEQIYVSFCTVMWLKGSVQSNTSYMKLLCGLSCVTRLWFLERHVAVEFFSTVYCSDTLSTTRKTCVSDCRLNCLWYWCMELNLYQQSVLRVRLCFNPDCALLHTSCVSSAVKNRAMITFTHTHTHTHACHCGVSPASLWRSVFTMTGGVVASRTSTESRSFTLGIKQNTSNWFLQICLKVIWIFLCLTPLQKPNTAAVRRRRQQLWTLSSSKSRVSRISVAAALCWPASAHKPSI